MQKCIILFHFLSFFTLLNSQNLFLEGELTSCHASLKHVDLEISSLKFELSAPEEEPKLQQSLTQTYRQSGSFKVRIPKAEWKKFPVLSENCLGGKTPFSLVLPRLLPLRIKADVNPKTLEMNWLEWLSPPALEEVLVVNLLSGTEGGDSEIFSKEEDVDLPSDLAEMKDPQAYPPGGNGYGSITYDNGDTYTGYFKNYRRDGKGIYRWVSGNTHDGYYQSNLRHGKGTWKVVGVGRWMGNWVRDSLEGYGKTVYDSGQTYEGNFQNWREHGLGKWTWPSGQYYEGSFQFGKFSGFGVMVFASGAKYAGNWSDSRRSGYGEMTYANQDTYAGNWLLDLFHGQGKYTAKDWWYQGNYQAGKRHGTGVYEDDRLRYEGLWKNHQIHGEGILKDRREGTIWKTVWQNGNVYGAYQGVMTTRDGSRFEGIFEGLLPKKGKVVFANQDSYEGPFLKGKFHGRGKYIFHKEGIEVEDEFRENSCLLSLEESLERLGISLDDDVSPPALLSQDGLYPEVTAVVSEEESDERAVPAAVLLVPFLKEAGVLITLGYLNIHRGMRFMTFAASLAATVVKYRTGPGSGIIYYREDTKKYQPDLFLYVGRTISPTNYVCRQKAHDRIYRKLHPKHDRFKFLQFETGINVLDPVYKLKEQAYIQQCEEASHSLCAPHGPNHLANKINSMGMAGFEKWKLQNPKEWFVIATTCGLKP